MSGASITSREDWQGRDTEMTIDHQTVEQLKAAGHYAAAGALAKTLGANECNYGCHYGMRSGLQYARELFRRGWMAA